MKTSRRRKVARTLAAAALTPVLVATGPADETLFPVPDVIVGRSPRSVVTADFNGDGVTDILTANFGSDDVSL